MTKPGEAEIKAELAGAHEALRDAEQNLSRGQLRNAISRAYYATFHSARAVLWGLAQAPKTHRGLQQLFGLHVIQSGLVTKDYSEILGDTFEQRELADYHHVTDSLKRDEVATLVDEARMFVQRMEEVIANQQPSSGQ